MGDKMIRKTILKTIEKNGNTFIEVVCILPDINSLGENEETTELFNISEIKKQTAKEILNEIDHYNTEKQLNKDELEIDDCALIVVSLLIDKFLGKYL